VRFLRKLRFWEPVLGAKKALEKINNRRNRENRKTVDILRGGMLTGGTGTTARGRSLRGLVFFDKLGHQGFEMTG
jgi:hypothetical protein